MATISSSGIGSGLDVETIITKLMTVERTPINSLQADTKKLDDKVSSYGKIQSALSSLRDAAQALTTNASWGATKATSADASSVGATSSDRSVAGSYSVSVTQLAKSQMVASSAFADAKSALGGGTLTIELGSWSADQGAFTAKADATALSLTFDAGATLQDVRDKINAAGSGVVASIVTDANGSRLALRSVDSGKDAGFRVSTDSGALSALAYDPAAGVNAGNLKQAATNALASINGIDIESESNTLTDVIDGLTIKLGQVTTAPVEVSVEVDADAIKKSVNAFADAYNALNTMLSSQTKYNADTKTAATLQGDSTIVGLQRQLRSLVGGVSGASTLYQRLADVGLDPQKDGSLKVNATKLDTAVAHLGDLKKMFATRDDAVPANNGFAQAIRAFADDTLGIDGSLSTKQDGLKSRIQRNDDREAALEDRMTLIEKRLRAQYTALDTQMANLNGLSSYVTQMINAMSKSS